MKIVSVIMMTLVTLVVGGCAGGVGPKEVAPTVDITGKWSGQWVATNPALGSGAIEMTVKQTGNNYSGKLLVTGTATDPSGDTFGVVSGNQVRILQPSNLTGSLTVKDNTMSGNIFGVVDANVTLRRAQ